MRVACGVVPHFLVEVERLAEPALRGRPVIVGGAPVRVGPTGRTFGCIGEERKEVLDCSPEAMARGVQPGMTLREALSRCAEAAFVQAHPERYWAMTQAMVEALLEISPLVEPAEPGVIYVGVDPSPRPPPLREPALSPGLSPVEGLSKGEGEALSTRSFALEVGVAEAIAVAAEQASGLSVRVGVADGKFAAYVAAVLGVPRFLVPGSGSNSELGTSELHVVPPGEGAAFLADLSVEDLPVSAEMRRWLRLLGLRTLGDLARLPPGPVAAEFGREGAQAWELAHGNDRSPLVPYRPPRSLSEGLTFPAPAETAEALMAALRRLLNRALRRPKMAGRAARGLCLRIHREDGQVWERQVTFREPVGSAERMLLALRSKIEGAAAEGRLGAFTEIELVLLDLCGESALQEGLFSSRRDRSAPLGRERMAEAARQLKARYGRPVLAKVMEVERWSRLPERRFALIDYDP